MYMGRIALVLASLALLPAALAVAAETVGRVAGVAPGVVDGQTAHTLVASGIKVVDVRTPAEFAQGHVPGAVNIPHDQMANRAGELGPPSTPLLLYCKSGRRTEIAKQALRDRGFTTLYDLQAYDRWVEADKKP